MKRILFIILLTIPFVGFGQGWEKTYNLLNCGEFGSSVQQTTDGGYIITGTKNIPDGMCVVDNSDVFLIKTDSNGDSLWTKTFGGLYHDYGYSVQQTSDGGYIISGYTHSNGISMIDVYLIKTDSGGNELWTKTYDDGYSYRDQGFSVQQTTDGGYIITGQTHQYPFNWSVFNNDDVLLIKTDGYGNKQWSKTYGGPNSDYGNSVQQTTDGGYIITGSKMFVYDLYYTIGTYDVYLIKTDSNGDSLWTKTFGGTDNDRGYSVQQTTDGGYIITGNFGTGIWSNQNNTDVYLIKTDSNGDSLWTKTFGGIGNDGGRSVQQTTDGGYIITGIFGTGIWSQTDSCGVYLIKTDSSGDSLWTKIINISTPWGTSVSVQWGTSVQQTTDGGYIITGGVSNYSCTTDYSYIFLIKTDGSGNITSTFNIPNPSSNRKLEKVVDLLGRETKPQTNTPFIEIYDDGSTEKKLVVD